MASPYGAQMLAQIIGRKVVLFEPLRAIVTTRILECKRLGIPAYSLEGNTPFPNILPGDAMVYTTREKALLSNDVSKLLELNPVAFAANKAQKAARSDECFGHQWTQLGICRDKLPHVPWYACTAATTRPEQQTIISDLNLHNVVHVRGILHREETSIRFQHYTRRVIAQGTATLLHLVIPLIKGKTLIYFSNMDMFKDIVNMLKNKDFKVASFTALTPSCARETILEDLEEGRLDVACCTSALEMGWRVCGLRKPIFNGLPSSITQLIQLLGRLARGTSDHGEVHFCTTKTP